ncbi:hypothetical protein I316_07859 [Kwoniella heveanensis BCC8398]|uniref:BZIP domain-containing protein n=1 Tax=Kwoniella heveanensis BCC8398 TaxID=1296120 RepID=A0A1B9GHN4_9TREE|nr:hypothetical protein I316_07859 [Kwoniella heveanensis BCC8398]
MSNQSSPNLTAIFAILALQQYIRDLEARVEVLSGDKEERVELMTLLVRNLLKENKELRDMVKNMASFVGEGLGSCLPRLGLSSDQLDAILNRADTDTAYEAFVNLKASRELRENNPGLRMGEARRRPSEIIPSKRKRETAAEATSSQLGSVNRGRFRNIDIGHAAGPSGSAKGKERESGSFGGDFGSTPHDGVLRPRPSRSGSPHDSYDFLFPDLDTLWSEAKPTETTAGSSSTSTTDNKVTTPQSIGRDYRHGYAQYLVGEDGTIPQPPTDSIVGAQPHSEPTDRSSIYTGTPDAVLGFGPMVPGASATGIGNNPALNRGPESSISSLAGPRPPLYGYSTTSNYARNHSPLMSADVNISDFQRREQLQQAIGSATNTDQTGTSEGPGMTAAEVAERRRQQDQLMRMIEEGDPSDRKMEAMQLITYHLNNFRLNPDYHLPPALRPTVVQRTVPHEHAIDGIIFPSFRDRMILLRGRYDLVEVFRAMLMEFTIHGDDILDYNNYEVSERFIVNYSILVDDQVINVANKWRAQRGQPPIVRPSQGE